MRHIYVYLYSYIYIYIHIQRHSCVCVKMYVGVGHVGRYVHTDIFISAYIHTYTHTHQFAVLTVYQHRQLCNIVMIGSGQHCRSTVHRNMLHVVAVQLVSIHIHAFFHRWSSHTFGNASRSAPRQSDLAGKSAVTWGFPDYCARLGYMSMWIDALQ